MNLQFNISTTTITATSVKDNKKSVVSHAKPRDAKFIYRAVIKLTFYCYYLQVLFNLLWSDSADTHTRTRRDSVTPSDTIPSFGEGN